MTKRIVLAAATAGHAEGGSLLNAFDNALLAAGIGNVNLVKVSSILPPDVSVVDLPKIKPGAIVPTAYAAMTSDVPGETIAAAKRRAYAAVARIRFEGAYYRRDIADKAIGYLSGAAISAMVYLGDQLGLYGALRDAGRVGSAELAARLKLDQRRVREWLHAQASAGLVRYAGMGLFELTAEQAAVLADEANPAFVTGGFALVFPLLQ